MLARKLCTVLSLAAETAGRRMFFRQRRSVFPEKRKKNQFFFRKGVAKTAFMWYNVSITFVD